MDNNQPQSPRRRLQALLAIPDNQRTEAQWDEIVELEIVLAPGNQENGPGRDLRTVPAAQQNRKPNAKPHHPKPQHKPQGQAQAQPKAEGGQPNKGNKPRRPHGKPRNKPPVAA